MLEKQDLQAIQDMIEASETRTRAYIGESISASETRTRAYIGDSISASENRTHAYIEGAVIPQLQLLAEGHQTLLETLAPKSRVDNLEDDVVFLKSIVKTLMQEVSELKKAQ